MTNRYMLIFILSVIVSMSAACDSGGGGEEIDGDSDRVETEIEGSVCTDGVSACDGTKAVICNKGQWLTLEDCANYEKICEKGICVYPSEDGDGEDTETEFDSEESDSDSSDSESNDHVNPYVESSAPLQDQEDVQTTQKTILINFSEVMDPDEIAPIQRAVAVMGHCGVGLSFSGEIRAGGKQLKLTMNESLHPGTEHHVVLNPDKWFDLAGNPLGEYTLSFTTSGETPDTPCADGDEDGDSSQNPYIETSMPYDGEMGVALDLNDIKIKFSMVMETYNYDLDSGITVTGDDSHQVDFSGSWIISDQWIRLDLLEGLHPDTEYTVTVAEGLESDAGNLPMGEVSISFSTSIPQEDGDYEPDLDPDTASDADIDNTPPSSILDLDDVEYSLAFDTPYNPQQHPRSVEAYWDAETEKIVVVHRNVPYDLNISSVDADLTQLGWNIELVEMVTLQIPSGTNYPFNITMTIDGAENFPGEWDVAVYSDGALEPDETDVVVP